MQLVFIHGAPGVGKLTVARELAALTEFRLFHNHLTVDLVSSVFAFGGESFVRLRQEIWLATFREAASQNLSLIFTFAPEATVPAGFVQTTINLVESLGGQVVFVELTCAEAEIERRLEDPSRRAFDKLSSVAQYRELKSSGAFVFPAIASALSLDTSNTAPADTAAKIYQYLDCLKR
ncbi:MAG: shikimate kinase [Acidobacteria bacterium]|nr:shikimate kinase [Acidobacteriota bacterium]